MFIAEALSIVDRLLEYFDSKLHSAPATPVREMDRSNLMTSKFNILWSFNRGVNNAYFHSEDLQKYDEWNAKLAHWIEHDESFTKFREKLENGEVKQRVHSGFSLPQKKLKGLWRQSLAEDAASARYASANSTFCRLMEEGDIIKAEASFRRFVDEAMDLERGYCRDLSCIIACDRIGDSVKAR
jgi:hypothetical protein